MIVTTESKAQNCRVMVAFDDRHDALIFVGRSSTHVRQEYIDSFMELLDEEERGHATTIQMQQWSGSPDAGRWVHKTDLKLPAPALVRVAA
ncbi:unnamed protein product [Gemmata massiliana]|uniref:Uncharacterized protein n=1 Tax=Gemmata massiliana TaxID=1210884 RepID=A0A6P2D1H4_9BACT|nr:hypothetical protein [Gemmata massiliana]VTR95121.1 unnamed protein product [Gemmata massiliana]